MSLLDITIGPFSEDGMQLNVLLITQVVFESTYYRPNILFCLFY